MIERTALPGPADAVAMVAPGESAAGRIPLRLRIGVTGHRTLDDEKRLRDDVEEVVAHIVDRAALRKDRSTVTGVSIVSALAEGADRIVADVVLQLPDTQLEAVLPFEAGRYLHDFETKESRDEFHRLLHSASAVTVVRSGSREEGYQRAGNEVVDRCDVLVAVWDGIDKDREAGTAATVRYARAREKPVFWVRATPRGGVVEEIGGEPAPITGDVLGPLSADAYQGLRRFNEEPYTEVSPDRLIDLSKERIAVLASQLPDDCVPRVLDWATPFFGRAESAAGNNQTRFRWSSAALFPLATLAVVVIGVRLTLWHEKLLVLAEVGLLAIVLYALWLGRRGHAHDRWISARYLAEWIRSAVFVALAGGHRPYQRDILLDDDATDAWLRRACTEMWLSRPPVVVADEDVPVLRRFLAEAWIDSQQRWHKDRADKFKRWREVTHRSTEVLFAVAVLVALAHLFVPAGRAEDVLSFWAVILPVSAAAITGFGAHREFRRHAERYGRMAGRLGRASDRMKGAQALGTVQTVAADTERMMREEVSEWFGVVRVHDVELPF